MTNHSSSSIWDEDDQQEPWDEKTLLSSDGDVEKLLEESTLEGIQTLSQEYEDALRTNSYTEFQQKLHSHAGRVFGGDAEEGGSKAFESFRVLATGLLQPDEKAVRELLFSQVPKQEIYDLVKDYFDNSVNSSNLCGVLLKSIYSSLASLKKLESALNLLGKNEDTEETEVQAFLGSLQIYRGTDNFFSQESFEYFGSVHDRYIEMEERLRVMQTRLAKKLKRTRAWSKVSTAALAPVIGVVLISTMAVAIIAYPLAKKEGEILTRPARSLESWLEKRTTQKEIKLQIQNTQLLAAARGTFVLIGHMATIQRLVTRSGDELEFLKDRIRFYEQRSEYSSIPKGVVDQLKIRQVRFSEHMKDLEEHVILFFLSLNRARKLVVQKISHL